MAVASTTYGTTDGVHLRAGWVVAARAAFGSGTTPTLTQVESLTDQTAAEIHAAMANAGYPLSTKASITTDAPRAVDWLAGLNEDGAAARVLMAFPQPGETDTAGYYRKRFEEGLALIKTDFLAHMGLARTRSAYNIVAGAATDSDGNTKLPLFTRGMDDYPGERSLTE